MSEDARLSKMLFEARELISMFNDMVERRAGREDTWSRRVRDQIDAYRAERGWSPHGFGDEDDNPKPERMPPGDDPRAGEEIPHV